MGQKINPIGMRIGSFLPWKSRWFSEDRTFKKYLIEDIKGALFLRNLNLQGLPM